MVVPLSVRLFSTSSICRNLAVNHLALRGLGYGGADQASEVFSEVVAMIFHHFRKHGVGSHTGKRVHFIEVKFIGFRQEKVDTG